MSQSAINDKPVSVKGRPRGLSNPNDLVEKFYLNDPGNHPDNHFKKAMSPFRYWVRSQLARFTDTQSLYLGEWQKWCRTPGLDVFFSYTALLASHTFYVICLPMPLFIGQFEMVRDMVFILGYSIFLSGFFKDYLCLPRPKSPPLHRITLSAYTSKEYGAPSSHTANASGITMLFMLRIFQAANFSLAWKLILLVFAIAYNFVLVWGRVYCGMHGLIDLMSGAIIGIFCFCVRIYCVAKFDTFNAGDHFWYPFVSIGWGLFILLYHIVPIDECPCFEDSVAFVGVICGMDVVVWIIEMTHLQNAVKQLDVQGGSLIVGIEKFVIGMGLIIVWKYVIGKPIVYKVLKNVFGVHDDRAERNKLREQWAKDHKDECAPYIGVSRIDIYGRFIIYLGIPVSVLVIAPNLLSYLNIIH